MYNRTSRNILWGSLMVVLVLLVNSIALLPTSVYAQDCPNVGGFPNFFEAQYNHTHVFGSISLNSCGGAKWQDVKASYLNYPDLADVPQMFRIMNQYATDNGYVAAIPTFFEATYPSKGLVYGAILLNSDCATWQDVQASYLNYPDLADVGQMFRAVNQYATDNGYVAAIPTFFEAAYPSKGLVYGVALLNSGCATRADIPAQSIGNPSLDDPATMLRAFNTFVTQ